MKLKDYTKLDYESYEHIFVHYCNGAVVTGLDNPRTTKPDAQYVDWYILLPAVMSEEERVRLLGNDYQSITKDALSDMRRGVIPVREYISNLFAKEDAVELIQTSFLKKVPQAIVGANRKRVIDEFWRVIRIDEDIPLRYKDQFKQEKIAATYEVEAIENNLNTARDLSAFCRFLADAFVFAVNGRRIIEGEMVLHPVVKNVLEGLDGGNRMFLYALLESMFEAVIAGDYENDNYELKSVNDSDFSDDDFRTVAYRLKDYKDTLGETYLKKYSAIRMFAIGLDQQHTIEIGGSEAVDALYAHYGLSKDDYSLLSIDPNVTNAEFNIILQNGKPARVVVNRKPDGSVDMQVIGNDEVQ